MITPMLQRYLFDHVLMNRVHVIDAMELCALLPNESVDMILCDLPYGMEKTKCGWDKQIDLAPMWAEFNRIITQRGAVVLTATQPFTSALIMSNLEMFRYQWYWEKSRGSNFGNSAYQPLRVVEDILVFSKSIASANQFTAPDATMKYLPQLIPLDKPYTREDKPHHKKIQSPSLSSHVHNAHPMIREYTHSTPRNLLYYAIENDSERGLHPTQKPVALFEYLIRTYTSEGDLVFDPFVGSGTTALAARNTKRRYICGDQSPEYVAIARDRVRLPFEARHMPVNDDVSHLPMFASLGTP